MAVLTKEELKTLSDETFYDNDLGEIDPSEHRAFNDDLIDSVMVEVFTGSLLPPGDGFKDGDIFIKI
jgi:hypothetical protein